MVKTKEDFIKSVDGAPISLEDVADRGVDCGDWTIATVCKEFINARDELEMLLEDLEVELG